MDATILAVVAAYFAVSLGTGFWVARKEKKRADDYFLAGRKLPWYAVALSMTGSNIGTEHFIGMVGTAYAFGLAPATFEWGNFIPYSMLVWIFLPYLFRKKLYTIPEFLERRYSQSTRCTFASLSLLHMVIAVLTPALYAGGRIIYQMAFQRQIASFNWGFMGCVLVISAVTAAYCIYGGLLSVVWTDVLQVAVLLAGGLLLVLIGVQRAGGLNEVIQANCSADATRCHLIQSASHKVSPWPGVATFWMTLSMAYVATNQFYIQRCLGAKSEWDAKMGVIGCAFIKFFLPVIIVFPGMVAFALFGGGLAEDSVYVRMINELLPPLGRGVLLAALTAAIMSTVSSVLNSASTIWSMDVYKRLLRPAAHEQEVVRVGRWSTFIVIVIGTSLTPVLVLWREGLFLFIQNMYGLFAPAIAVIFVAAFFWRRAHARAATFTLVFGFVVAATLWILTLTVRAAWVRPLDPLLNRAAVTLVLCFGALIFATFLVRRSPEESYDPQIIWNRRWAHLPQAERALNRGLRNLMFWWIVLISGSVAIFVVFG